VTAVTVLAAASTLAGCGLVGGHPSRQPAADTQSVGLTTFSVADRTRVPTLAGPALDGGRVSVAELGAGNIVFVNVWASWCGPCRTESPLLARSAAAMSGRGVRFIGIDEEDRPGPARAFARATGATYPHLVDADGSLLRRLRMLPQTGIPSTLVIDRHGRVAARVIGRISARDIRQVVDRLDREP
jgi:thiol-disulfide isomerase/thioredoxin